MPVAGGWAKCGAGGFRFALDVGGGTEQVVSFGAGQAENISIRAVFILAAFSARKNPPWRAAPRGSRFAFSSAGGGRLLCR